MSQYQICKTNLDFTEARSSEWQWHQLGRMQVCTSLQTDIHASTPPLSFFTGWMLFLPTNQQRRSTEGLIGMQNKLKSFTGMSSNWLWTVNGIVSLSRHSVIVVRAHGTGLIILKQKKTVNTVALFTTQAVTNKHCCSLYVCPPQVRV